MAASVADLDSSEAILVVDCDPLHEMPILDLRIRKAVRRHGARLAVATDRPSALDGGADETARYAPGFVGSFLSALAGAVGAEGHEQAPDELGADAERIAGALKPGSTVIVWAGEANGALVECARKLDAKLLEVPEGANGRGLREVGCLPHAGPGLSEVPAGRDAAEIRDGLADGSLEAAFLLNADPVRDLKDGPAWSEALGEANFVLAVSMFENASTRHADVVFPTESYAEKEGTVTHPDGRLQRLRPGVPHPGGVRPMWQVLAELSALLGEETGIDSTPEALDAIASEVPFYAGITHEEIGGRGVRWQERKAASAFPRADGAGARDEVPVHAPEPAAPSAPEPADTGRIRASSAPVAFGSLGGCRRSDSGHLSRPVGVRGDRTESRPAVLDPESDLGACPCRRRSAGRRSR